MLLHRLARLAIHCAWLVGASPAIAGTYYVATTGNVNATGTRTDPWDIVRANRNAQPGDIIYVRRGVYHVGIRPLRGGAAASPIVFALEPGYPAGSVARFSGTVPRERFVCFNLSQRSYVHIENLHCDGGVVGAQATVENAVSLRSADFNRIEGCQLLRTWGDMVSVVDGGDYNVIRNSSLRSAGANGSDSGEVVKISNSHHNLVEGNLIEYGGHTGIQIYDGSWNVVRNNTVRNPWTTGGSIFGFVARHNLVEGNRILHSAISESIAADGQISWNAWTLSGSYNVFRRNFFYANEYLGLDVVAKALSMQSQAEHNAIYHNVFHANGLAGLRVYANRDDATLTGGLRFVNNVFHRNQDAGTVQVEYNLVWGGFDGAAFRGNDFLDTAPGEAVISVNGRLDTLAYHEAVNPQNFSDNLEEDPRFVNATAGDFRLEATSPLIDSGTWLTRTRSAGSGTAIPVEEADFFIGEIDYGIAGVAGDSITLEGGPSVRILSVDYANRVVHVDRDIPWSSGQLLTLDFNGAGPDVGAIEY